MRVAEVSHWLAQDDDLGERWKSAAVNIRTHAAEFTLRGAIAANPDATRMFIVNRCLWAARWLEQKNPKLLDQILPRSRQRSLHFQFALDF